MSADDILNWSAGPFVPGYDSSTSGFPPVIIPPVVDTRSKRIRRASAVYVQSNCSVAELPIVPEELPPSQTISCSKDERLIHDRAVLDMILWGEICGLKVQCFCTIGLAVESYQLTVVSHTIKIHSDQLVSFFTLLQITRRRKRARVLALSIKLTDVTVLAPIMSEWVILGVCY